MSTPIGEVVDYLPSSITSFPFPPGVPLVAYPDLLLLMIDQVGGVQFTPTEWRVLLPVLISYPYHCPYEVVYTSFNYGHTEPHAVEQSRRRLYAALEDGSWDREMRPVRNVMSRARVKMHVAFDLRIAAVLETGWLLQIEAACAA